MAVCLFLLLLLQGHVLFTDANVASDCMTRSEVMSIIQSMEQKYETTISSQELALASMKTEYDAAISALKAEINDLKRNNPEQPRQVMDHRMDSVTGLRTENPDEQTLAGGRTSEKIHPGVLSDGDNKGYQERQAKRYLLGNGGVSEVGTAFSVTISTTGITHLGNGQAVHFDKVISNLGNAFDANISVFRVPVNGWYVFSLTLMARPNDTQQLDVVKKGVHMFHCYAEGTGYSSASRTAVIHANQGDDIWVQTSHLGTTVHGYEHTSFTGFLLYAD